MTELQSLKEKVLTMVENCFNRGQNILALLYQKFSTMVKIFLHPLS